MAKGAKGECPSKLTGQRQVKPHNSPVNIGNIHSFFADLLLKLRVY